MKQLKLFTASILLIFCIFLPQNSWAQAYAVNPFGSSYWQPTFGAGVGGTFNHQDFLMEIYGGYEEVGYDFSITFNGLFRPFHKVSTYEKSEGLYYQVKDKAYQFSLDFEKRLYFLEFLNANKLGVYAMVRMGWAYNNHKGVARFENSRFVFNPGGGLSWQFTKNSRLSVGYIYNYHNLTTMPHMAQVKLTMFVKNNENNEK